MSTENTIIIFLIKLYEENCLSLFRKINAQYSEFLGLRVRLKRHLPWLFEETALLMIVIYFIFRY